MSAARQRRAARSWRDLLPRAVHAGGRSAASGPLLILIGTVACGSSVSGPQAAACGPGPHLTFIPVSAPDINLISVIGGLGPPVHTLPTAHAGFLLARGGVSVTSPGDLAITELRRTTYVTSPFRQGHRDYALFFQVCRELTGWFGHLTSLASSIPSNLDWRDCQTYSTAEETVQACTAEPRGLRLGAGAPMGTAGVSPQLGLGLDFGMLDERVSNYYVNRSRYHRQMFHATCPWEQFDPATQAALFSKLRDGFFGAPSGPPSGEPRCGTMSVDVANTAKGVWAEPGVGAVQGDERRFITLANYPYRPQEFLALSLGPAALGAGLYVVPRQTTGRVNRAFEQVTNDGQIHCYTSGQPGTTSSWLLAVSSANRLSIARVGHASGASPCVADPSTWSLGAGALTMER